MATLLGSLGAFALVVSLIEQVGTYRPALRVFGAGAVIVAVGMMVS